MTHPTDPVVAMREACAKVADARFAMKQRLYLDAAKMDDRAIMQVHLSASREAHDIAAAIRALPIPAAQPDPRDEALRLAREALSGVACDCNISCKGRGGAVWLIVDHCPNYKARIALAAMTR